MQLWKTKISNIFTQQHFKNAGNSWLCFSHQFCNFVDNSSKHFPNRDDLTNHFSLCHDDNHKHHQKRPRKIQFNYLFGSHSASVEFLQHLSYEIHQNTVLRINFVRKGKKTAKVFKC